MRLAPQWCACASFGRMRPALYLLLSETGRSYMLEEDECCCWVQEQEQEQDVVKKKEDEEEMMMFVL